MDKKGLVGNLALMNLEFLGLYCNQCVPKNLQYVCVMFNTTAVYRYMEQLQRWLDGDPVDHLSTPLFIPSSTLLSMPTTIMHAPTAKTRDATLTQVYHVPSQLCARVLHLKP